MAELVIRNSEFLKKLDYIKDKVLSADIATLSRDNHMADPKDALTCGEKYLTEEYLYKHMNDTSHRGFPIQHYSTPIESVKDKHESLQEIFKYSRGNFVTEAGANSDAVFLYYPPGGFVGWHTNQNNSGYQFILSWSEKGDGYFQYYDKQQKQIVRLQDQAGWNCRYYHFGKEEQDHCWHSAYTNVPRITVCLLFRWWDKPSMKSQVLDMKDLLIEEIQTEV
tara:strand:+ start:532 stop:1197 length:666 start_codon:yes stop_codon:yes gene_type:complete